MKHLIIYVVLFTLIIPAMAQEKIVFGKVTDSLSGNVLAGVTIGSLGNNAHIITDSTGYFRLKTSDKDTLIFSFVGYEPVRRLAAWAADTLIIIRMIPERVFTLDDVVVYTGYQSLRKARNTGSFIQIDNNMLNRATGSNIIERLDGVTSSLLFSSGSSYPPLTVRGLGTLTTMDVANPLIVLDNFPYEGDINNINPNDIESITILRDAAASSIWGAKAGNGVIVITSKKSSYNQPMRFSINSSLIRAKKPDLFTVPQMTTSDFIDVEQFLFAQHFYDADIASPNRPVLSPVIQILTRERLGEISRTEAVKQIDALRNEDVRNDLFNFFYRSAMHQQYSVALRGGSQTVGFRTSLGFDKDLGSLVGNQDNRLTFVTNLSLQPLKNLAVTTNVNGTWIKLEQNSPMPLQIMQSRSMYPYSKLVDESGNALVLEKDFDGRFKDTAGSGLLLDWRYRPLEEINNADKTSMIKNILTNIQARYSMSSTFNIGVIYQHQEQQTSTRNYYSPESYYARNLINLFSAIDDGNITRAIPLGGILDLGVLNTISNSARGQLDYNQTFGLTHSVIAIAGAEIGETKVDEFGYRTYGYDDDILTAISVNFDQTYPILDGLNYLPRIPNPTDFSGKRNRMVSFYTNASYSYSARYTVSVSARKDASNILGTRTNNKWKPLWSTGFSWEISKEKFFQISWLPLLKLRSTYGYSGNVNNAISALTTLDYETNRSRTSSLPYALVTSPPNADLRWEKISTTNFAVDFRLKNRVLAGTIEYYRKKSTDLIAAVPVDISVYGQPSLTRNSAHLSGNGVDVTLNISASVNRVTWESVLNYSYNNLKVTKYLLPSEPYTNVGSGGNIITLEGYHPYSIVSYKWAGLNPENGNPVGFLKGVESEKYSDIIRGATWDDLIINGSSVPKIFGGWLNTFSYRQFAISCNITYKLAYFFRKKSIRYSDLFASGQMNSDFEKRWQKPGDELHTTVPSMTYPANYYRDGFYGNSEVTVLKGDHIRLQDINLTYDIPTRRPGAPTLHLYVYARNLGIIWRANKESLDPDTRENYPIPASLSLGCKINL